jgi:hypothetical protein
MFLYCFRWWRTGRMWLLFYIYSPMFLWLYLLECNMSWLSRRAYSPLCALMFLFASQVHVHQEHHGKAKQRTSKWLWPRHLQIATICHTIVEVLCLCKWASKVEVPLPFSDWYFQFSLSTRTDKSVSFRLWSCFFIYLYYITNLNNVISLNCGRCQQEHLNSI